MKFIILSSVLIISSFTAILGQKIQEKPKHPKGSLTTQMEALPYYNEAIELHKRGNDKSAIRSLKEAISISFSLVEAQLLLADIYYEKGMYEEALIYYNSGIDFVIEQPAHYYFRLFELALQFGNYDLVKHNLKHFKKLHGTKEKYDENFSYTNNDYEYTKHCMNIVYDYKNWKGNYQIRKINNASKLDDFFLSKNSVVLQKQNLFQKATLKKGELKKFKTNHSYPKNIKEVFLSKDGNYLLFSLKVLNKNEADIYYSKKQGKKWLPSIKLKGEVNSNNWEGYPFLSSDNQTLYFSSSRNGSKDIFMAKVDLESNTSSAIKAIDRVNSPKDEIAPMFNSEENRFYFSSNGFGGFGGYDIFECADFETLHNVKMPINPRNIKSPINTHRNEIRLSFYSENSYYFIRKDIYGESELYHCEPLTAEKEIIYEIKIQNEDNEND